MPLHFLTPSATPGVSSVLLGSFLHLRWDKKKFLSVFMAMKIVACYIFGSLKPFTLVKKTAKILALLKNHRGK